MRLAKPAHDRGEDQICGLAKISTDPRLSWPEGARSPLDYLRGTPWWYCGMSRNFAVQFGPVAP